MTVLEKLSASCNDALSYAATDPRNPISVAEDMRISRAFIDAANARNYRAMRSITAEAWTLANARIYARNYI